MYSDRKRPFKGFEQEKINVLEELFFKYHGRLVLFSKRFTGNLEASQDIVQEAFVSLWEKPESFKFQESPKAYLFQSVRNRSLNFIRDENGHSTIEQEIAYKIEAVEKDFYTSYNNPYYSLLELEMNEKIDNTIKKMPEKCRQIYQLSRHNCLKNREIAESLGISIKMVEKYISKALRILRLELSDYLPTFVFLFLCFNCWH